MTVEEFDDDARLHASGQLSRRKFINRLVAGGMTAAAAVAFASATAEAAPVKGGTPKLYGTPPGHGGTPPGHGGTPPPLETPPPGHGGTPPGQGRH
jgi:hypothetical protein